MAPYTPSKAAKPDFIISNAAKRAADKIDLMVKRLIEFQKKHPNAECKGVAGLATIVQVAIDEATTESPFDKCTERKTKGGSLEIRCKLGLWSAEGRDHDAVEREARHYWAQYFRDGEYAKLLKS